MKRLLGLWESINVILKRCGALEFSRTNSTALGPLVRSLTLTLAFVHCTLGTATARVSTLPKARKA